MKSLLIKGGTVVRGSGAKHRDVYTQDDVIVERVESPREIIEAEGLLLFPGLIDSHVHFRDPGLTHKETMNTGAAAARAGGITTVCEMPNTFPPTVTLEAFKGKVERAEKIADCDIRFFFGVTEKEHLEELRKSWENPQLRERCPGVKVYFDHSTGNQGAAQDVIEEAFKVCAQLDVPLVAHCEDAEINLRSGRSRSSTTNDIRAHSEIRPPESEAKAIEDVINLAIKHGTQLHIAHLSTKQGVNLVREAKEDNVSVTCEATPHHLFLTTDDYETLGALGKMNPPLRPPEHREALWGGIEDGTVDCVASDHAPHLLKEKNEGPPLSAPSGVPGVETMLPLLLMVAAGGWPNPKGRRVPARLGYNDIITLCFENPNKIFNLGKSGVRVKAPADIAIIDPQDEWIIKGKELHSKCGWTPYEGWRVRGRVVRVV